MTFGATSQLLRNTAAAPSWWTTKHTRRFLLLLIALLPSFISLLPLNDDGPVIYPYCAAMHLLAAWACWKASLQYRTERVRWQTVAVAEAIHALAYIVTTVRNAGWVNYNGAAWFSNACIGVSWVLFLPALMGVRAVRGKWVRVLDYSLAALVCALVMRALGSGARLDGGTTRISVIMCCTAAVAIAAYLSYRISSQPGTRFFSSVIAVYLTASLADNFLVDIVNLDWSPHPSELFANLLIAVPELLLCEWIWSMPAPPASKHPRKDIVFIDSLQPSIMAFGGVALALYGFRANLILAAAAILLLVLFYAVRTHLFYHHLFQQQNRLREHSSQMESLATRDPLTGCGNRRWFEAEAEKLLSAERTYPCSMVLVDTDYFKQINDTFGHPAGDDVLRSVAEVLTEVTSEVKRGCCARIGGDEFGALWPATDIDEGKGFSERLRLQFTQRCSRHGTAATLSIGVATATARHSLIDMIAAADRALYQAKAAGRNTVWATNEVAVRPDGQTHQPTQA